MTKVNLNVVRNEQENSTSADDKCICEHKTDSEADMNIKVESSVTRNI